MRKPQQYVRRVGRTLVWLFQRAGLWLKWRPAAPASRSPLRTLHFESLEPRLLLSADLLPVSIHTPALNDPHYASDSPTVSVLVRNQGDTAPDQPVSVNFYASAFAGGEETLLGGALLDVSSLLPGDEASAVPITLDLSRLTLAGEYSLRAEIDPDNRIAESNEANNQLSLPAALTLSAQPGGPRATTAGLPASGGAETGIVTSKYFVLPSAGQDFIDFELTYGSLSLAGQEIVFVGSSNIDAIFVRPGVSIDFTQSKTGADKVYLPGAWGDYTAALAAPGSSVMTLTRGSGSSQESVRFIAIGDQTTSDQLVFADGTLSSYDLYQNLTAGTALPGLGGETSVNPGAPAADGSTLNANLKAFALQPTTFALAQHGLALTVVGSSGVDTVYVPDGGNIDANQLKGGIDLIYFRGNWADYTKTVPEGSNVITFSREVNGMTETVKVISGASDTLNDRLIFADGSVRSYDALNAINTDSAVTITAVSGYDASTTTPGIDTTPPALLFDLAPTSDTDVAGDLTTSLPNVSLTGSTEAGASVRIPALGLSTTADANGLFQFDNIPLAVGINSITL